MPGISQGLIQGNPVVLVEVVARAIDAQDDFPVYLKHRNAGIPTSCVP